ncbi:MAG TPA: hypothetical protein VIY86_03535, partial [Pirellulaceae bacterium]
FWLFVAVSGSGIAGLVITRRYPRQLTKLRDEAIWERIPDLRDEIMLRSHEIACQMAGTAPASAVADFYAASLLPYFVRATPWRHYLWRTSRVRNQLRNALRQMSRYGSMAERTVQEQFARLVDQRDDLDFHAVHQGRLKAWLFAHIALTYALLLVAGLHTILAHAFRGT